MIVFKSCKGINLTSTQFSFVEGALDILEGSYKTAYFSTYKMTAFWRQVGLNYISYSQICARVVRQVLKEPFKSNTFGRDGSVIKTARWEGGKVIKTATPGAKLVQS